MNYCTVPTWKAGHARPEEIRLGGGVNSFGAVFCGTRGVVGSSCPQTLGGTLLDPFAGSGTMLAAWLNQKAGRVIGIAKKRIREA
ncbi:MAG: hypothetical protein WKF77_22065 [Planctomycetaceae bacterium]